MIIVCLTCNITLPRRRGSRPDGARLQGSSITQQNSQQSFLQDYVETTLTSLENMLRLF